MNDLLMRGEQLLWEGSPQNGPLFTKIDVVPAIFGVFFSGFAIFWEIIALSSVGAPIFFSLWGIPFILVGFYVGFGRVFVRAARRKKTWYTVTDKRVIRRCGNKVESQNYRDLPHMTVELRPDGSGTIWFEQTYYRSVRHGGTTVTPYGSFALEYIPDAEYVYNLICEQVERI